MDRSKDIGLMDKHRLLEIFDYLNEQLKENIDAYILCKELNIKNKTEILDIISIYVPITLLKERQRNFIIYLGKDLGYDWE